MTTLLSIAAGVTTTAAVLAVLAFIRRPSLADRLLAVEVALIATACTIVIGLGLGLSRRFVDVALVLGLVGFTSTLAVARYLESEPAEEEV